MNSSKVLLFCALNWAFGFASAELVETQMELPVAVTAAQGQRVEHTIKLTLFVDDATPSPRPLIVINHGRAVTARGRSSMGRSRYPEAAKFFAKLGYAVAVPTRIGYGVTGGDDLEDTGPCNARDFAPGFLVVAQQTQSVLRFLKASLDDVLKDRSVVLGQSFGGAGSVALASLNPPGVAAIINFAGGSGGDPKGRPGRPCSQPLLESAYLTFGKTARTPMLWLYTENDLYFGAEYPRAWFKAYTLHGAPAQLVQFPPHGDDGHSLFVRFGEVWQPVVAEFLKTHGKGR
jgi:dienelactone hydrolase